MSNRDWFSIKEVVPLGDTSIMVEDHEGNHAVGMWHEGFINVLDFPLGHIVRWRKIELQLYCYELNKCMAFYEDGEPISLPAMYDPSPPL